MIEVMESHYSSNTSLYQKLEFDVNGIPSTSREPLDHVRLGVYFGGIIWTMFNDPASLRSWCMKGTNESSKAKLGKCGNTAKKEKKCQIPQHFNTKSYVITDTETTTLYVNVRALIMQNIAQNAIVFRDMYLQCPARNNNG